MDYYVNILGFFFLGAPVFLFFPYILFLLFFSTEYEALNRQLSVSSSNCSFCLNKIKNIPNDSVHTKPLKNITDHKYFKVCGLSTYLWPFCITQAVSLFALKSFATTLICCDTVIRSIVMIFMADLRKLGSCLSHHCLVQWVDQTQTTAMFRPLTLNLYTHDVFNLIRSTGLSHTLVHIVISSLMKTHGPATSLKMAQESMLSLRSPVRLKV